MFTGIIESLGTVTELVKDQQNLHISINSTISKELKIDQSVAHNGICLTVVKCDEHSHTVTAIQETLLKTNLNELKVGDKMNLERCMQMNGRLDGHIVQGHVDTTAKCIAKEDQEGSWLFTFEHPKKPEFITVEKGSICVNGISLTVVNSKENQFSVAIIPYTYEHTNLSNVNVGDHVNLEFDILGKYVAKLMLNK
jgi:riboflavin synthase